MAKQKFRKEADMKAVESFLDGDEARRRRNADFSDPWLTCVVCGHQMRQSYAVEHKLEKCPQCGTDKPATVTNLNYDPAVAHRPTPTLAEAQATERANQALLRRPHNRIV